MINPKIKVRKVPPRIDEKQLNTDLKFLRQEAKDNGAVNVAIIDKDAIIFNAKLAERCRKTSFISYHWPVNYPNDSVKEAVLAFQRTIFFRVAHDKDMPEFQGDPIPDENYRKIYLQVYEIATLIESTAFYMGYHLALGFAAGNCRSIFCPDDRRCIAMLNGQACRQPYRGRPSMEAAGIDARAMARKLGWKNVPTLKNGFPSGIVLIA